MIAAILTDSVRHWQRPVLTYVMCIQEEEGRTRVRGVFIQAQASRYFITAVIMTTSSGSRETCLYLQSFIILETEKLKDIWSTVTLIWLIKCKKNIIPDIEQFFYPCKKKQFFALCIPFFFFLLLFWDVYVCINMYIIAVKKLYPWHRSIFFYPCNFFLLLFSIFKNVIFLYVCINMYIIA